MAMGQIEHRVFQSNFPLPRINSVLHTHNDIWIHNNMYHVYVNEYSLGYKYQKFNSNPYNNPEISHAHQGYESTY